MKMLHGETKLTACFKQLALGGGPKQTPYLSFNKETPKKLTYSGIAATDIMQICGYKAFSL